MFATIRVYRQTDFLRRFLFGIPLKTVEAMYGPPAPGHPDPLGQNLTDDIVGRLPIIGLFSR
jgi:hypothetical protein